MQKAGWVGLSVMQTGTGHPLSPGERSMDSGFSASGPLNTSGQFSPKGEPAHYPKARIPREGPARGGGKMFVFDRTAYDNTLAQLPSDSEELLPDLIDRRPSNATSLQSQRATSKEKSGSGGDTGFSRSNLASREQGEPKRAGRQLSHAERRRAELTSKWEKIEAVRDRDQKIIQERVDRQHQLRGERFQRLLDNVTGRDNLAYTTAMQLRERDAHQQRRRNNLYAVWDEKVYQPLATQAYEHLNPPDRAAQQALTGTKNVQFQLPNEKKVLIARYHQDPVRQPLHHLALEASFHQSASAVLGPYHAGLQNSRSAPNLSFAHRNPSLSAASSVALSGVRSSGTLPKATSRPTLEPMHWHQVQLQGSLYGHFAQVAEHGVGFRRILKGGTDQHMPDESDGIAAVGKRTSRITGHNDPGILRGDVATQGEASTHKLDHGASTAAPTQDHYLFETGKQVTDLEFPLGKKIFPEYH